MSEEEKSILMNTKELTGKIELDARMQAGNIQRFHTAPFGRIDQTVGHHTYRVAQIVMFIWPEFVAPNEVFKCLLAALDHDVAEIELGDIPHLAKRNFFSGMAEVEEDLAREMGLISTKGLPEGGAELVKVADWLECMYFAREQMQYGNKWAETVLKVLSEALAPMVEDKPEVKKLVEKLYEPE